LIEQDRVKQSYAPRKLVEMPEPMLVGWMMRRSSCEDDLSKDKKRRKD
jgi:hypothetical protein